MAKNFVQLKGVQKSYDSENLVVRDLNLDVRAGTFLNMLGPSESCRTTMLMMISVAWSGYAGAMRKCVS